MQHLVSFPNKILLIKIHQTHNFTFFFFIFIDRFSFFHISATSALDNESEKIVQDALDRAAEGILS